MAALGTVDLLDDPALASGLARLLARQRVIAYVDTGTTMFSSSLTVATSGAATARADPPAHHPGLRFFRRSQVSEDLFDAFRNMYLAFELLLSTRYPKTRGFEIDWLRASLTAAVGDVLLTDLAPAGNASPVEFVISTVYDNARLPLFHAKDGKTYFVPSPDERDRAPVKAALTMLTHIVVRMAESWHGIRRPRTSLSDGAKDAMFKAPFERASFVVTADAKFSPDDSLSSPSITSGVRFAAEISDTFDGERRFNIRGSIGSAALERLARIEMIHLVNDKVPLTSSKYKAALDVRGFDRFETVQFSRIIGAGEPRVFYSR